ncbi:MAG: poly(3-hydroxybutyrate) depolymerase [Rhodospirillaceae bacterium]|jgi:poly(3-hydroxybutyrate) depolymerase|nr:poly(3-hydroxybutyrate) depolymerase [Rhodospirillaceae bacterium]
MLYLAYETQSDLLQPVRGLARSALAVYRSWFGASQNGLGRNLAAGWELAARAGLTHERPPFGIDRVRLDGREVAVSEQPVLTTPFATLLHFRKEAATIQPRVLVVAPLSGHFPTLLRSTIKTLLPDHDVFITDWQNARDIPLSAGRFGLDEYVEHLIRFLGAIGPGAHVLAVCQPCVQVLSAVAVMAEDGHPAQPRSMTLMAGPVDTRINPTKVNKLATGRSLDWFERNLIAAVSWRHRGAGRRVYPGFVQLSAFLAMNIERHLKSHRELYDSLAKGDTGKAETIKKFYDEYFAVSDLSAEFYLETVRDVFQQALLAKGELTYRGRRIDLGAIRETALLTIEGELDDICGAGQTAAALELCSGLKPQMKRHHLQPGAGHYGVFSGRRWESQIYPIFREVVLTSE